MNDVKPLVITIQSWDEVVLLAKKMPQYIFRGQPEDSWGLSTKIERVCWGNDFPTTFLKNREDSILREFQRRAHHFINNPPEVSERLEWLALIQHYGGPTRLLDFTHSIYIAAFFAMENATNDAAIWALNEDYLWQHTDNVMKENETMYDLHDRGRKIVEKNLSGTHAQKVAMIAVPERLNERISIQQGVFVIPGDLNFSFVENLAETYDMSPEFFDDATNLSAKKSKHVLPEDCFEEKAIKINLPLEIHNRALLDLDSMNINAATLFPGLEGFARSLNKHLRDVE